MKEAVKSQSLSRQGRNKILSRIAESEWVFKRFPKGSRLTAFFLLIWGFCWSSVLFWMPPIASSHILITQEENYSFLLIRMPHLATFQPTLKVSKILSVGRSGKKKVKGSGCIWVWSVPIFQWTLERRRFLRLTVLRRNPDASAVRQWEPSLSIFSSFSAICLPN